MRMRKIKYSDREVEYDADAPCIVCGEPVIGASMGGTVICGSCDLGKCRYCGMQITVFKKSVDGGESKKGVLKHMQWHHNYTPDVVEKINAGTIRMMDKLEAE